MLEEVKKALRITNNEFDSEIMSLIQACESDLETSGVATYKINSRPLCKQAIILYCKAYFGFDNPDSEKLINSYEHIKKKVAITYREG